MNRENFLFWKITLPKEEPTTERRLHHCHDLHRLRAHNQEEQYLVFLFRSNYATFAMQVSAQYELIQKELCAKQMMTAGVFFFKKKGKQFSFKYKKKTTSTNKFRLTLLTCPTWRTSAATWVCTKRRGISCKPS